MNIKSLGIKPISRDYPAGKNVRYDAEFEEIQSEIDKYVHGKPVEWEKVNLLASAILEKKSKDLLAAGYLSAAQIRINGIEGFITSLIIYHDLLNNFWEELYPPMDRIRGRISAIEWWITKSEELLKKGDINSFSSKNRKEALDYLDNIEKLFIKYLNTPPLMDGLKKVFENKTLVTEQENDTFSEDFTESPEIPNTSSLHTENLFESAFREIQKAARMLRETDLSNPKAFRNNRIAVWSVLEALPPDTEGRTRIYPPEPHLRKNLKILREKRNWSILLKTVENELCRSLFWIDLNRFAAEALASLGEEYRNALDAVCIETAFFIHRLPGLENLLFSNGTPFADNNTKEWLNSIDFWARAAVPEPLKITQYARFPQHREDSEPFPVPSKVKEAEDVIKKLHTKLQKGAGPSEFLRWRLAMSKILLNTRQADLAIPHIDECMKTMKKYALEQWEPDLALKVLKISWEGYSSSPDFEKKAQDAFNRIVKIDLSEAMKLKKKKGFWSGFMK